MVRRNDPEPDCPRSGHGGDAITPDLIERTAAVIVLDPVFPEAAAMFCRAVTDLFAGSALLRSLVHDTGSYAVIAALAGLRAGSDAGWAPTRDVHALLAGDLSSVRRTTRQIARLIDLGVVECAADPADRWVRPLRATPATMTLLDDWHRAHVLPLRLWAPGSAAPAPAAARWKAMVVMLRRDHGYTLLHPFPDIAAIMKQAGGYLAMLALRLKPDAHARALGPRFGVSATQMRSVLPHVRALDPETVDRWLATEIGFARLIAAGADAARRAPGLTMAHSALGSACDV